MKQKTGVKQTRQRYSEEFKEQALRRAEQEGVATVSDYVQHAVARHEEGRTGNHRRRFYLGPSRYLSRHDPFSPYLQFDVLTDARFRDQHRPAIHVKHIVSIDVTTAPR
ncbi:hypothetical protein DWU98_06765 [Dyella monticola]|uniref:Uncharacterized protein n=1 Tax=Dyella monticola TaxID=1927958 RepID=A0A370X3I3_9GAMM|nr:hypothetical protein [Dyella monticola]RDS82840.1 hypothetical protein DWU98_06765 [Dyella monticola]